MNHTPFSEFLRRSPCILGEGAVIERLHRSNDFDLDPDIANSGFIYDRSKRTALAAIIGQYLDIGYQYGLPLLLSTPTWRAGRERIARAGLADRDVNADNFRFLDKMRRKYGEYGQRVVICGLMSCRGDAYAPDEALDTADALDFHFWQADKLARSGVDFIMAATLPALSEATGLAAALAAAGAPYIVSFVLRPEGTLLDGTPLKEAIAAIDARGNPKPTAYMANCTHASIFKTAMLHKVNSSALVRERVVGLLANTAALTPEELDDSPDLVEEDPETFARALADLRRDPGMKILGGCCGTDHRHINSLAKKLAAG